jgi:hypothetical protein
VSVPPPGEPPAIDVPPPFEAGPPGPEAAPPPGERAQQPLLRLRPLGLGEILDDIFRVYRRHFGLLCGIALLLSVPTYLLQLFSGTADQVGFATTLIGDIARPAALAAQTPPGPPNYALVGLSYLVIIAVVPFTMGAVTWAAIALALGQPVSVRSALQAILRRYWGLLGLAVLYVLLTPLALCLPVFIWLVVRWALAVPAMLAEGIGPVRGLDRSWTLTSGSWWRLFGILLIAYLLTSAVQYALSVLAFPIALLVPFVPQVVRGAIVLTISTAAQVAVLPIIYLALVLLYFDLRIRRENFDLDQLARLAAAPPA